MSDTQAIPAMPPPPGIFRKSLKVVAWIVLALVLAFVGLFAVAVVVTLRDGDARKQVPDGTECHYAGSGESRMRICTTISGGSTSTHIQADPER